MEDARRGLNCPACLKFFTPDLPPATAPEVASRTEQKANEAEQIRTTADNFRGAAIFLLALGLLILLACVIQELSGSEFVSGWVWAGSFIGTAFWLYLVAQIIHIRANTLK